MKLKKIMLVTFILLAILTVSAVGASEDVTVDGELAVTDVEENPIEESTDDVVVNIQSTEVEDFYIDYEEQIPIENDYNIVTVNSYDDVDGNVTVSVDNSNVYNEKFNWYTSLDLNDLKITAPGEYNILVNFVPVAGSSLTLANYKLFVTEKEEYIGINAEIYSDVDISRPYHTIVYNDYDDELEGNIIVYINNEIYYNGKIYEDDDIEVMDVTKKLPVGTYLVQVKYDDGEKLTLIKSSLTRFYYNLEIDEYPEYLSIGSNHVFEVSLPDDATGSLYVLFNGNEFSVNYKDGYGSVTIPTQNLELGKEYQISLVLRNDPLYSESPVIYDVTTVPSISSPDIMSVGENEIITLELPSKYSGTLNLYKAKEDDYGDYVKDGNPIASANVVNGKASIRVSQSNEGDYIYIIEYVSGSYSYSTSVYFEVYKNTPGITAAVLPATVEVGNSVTVKLTGPKDLNQDFYLSVDGVTQDKALNFFNLGEISQSIKFTTLGQHIIKVWGYDQFYSNTFDITVKQASAPAKTPAKTQAKTVVSLTLKTVKVKKSAKKLVLQATLKINKKAKKGLKVIFKFNGKKYTAKTNKKGVAKVTIKKKVLKKLKVGKKVKYQVSYGKKTVKKTAKVKK
ncbi:MAG: hypothetical protein IJ258_02685 [Methanobrevibacter sp.]|uniref:hypothetical protein n=1 Tax=Methanobrevibacter sp. TaxID=66852 RepID=UPI0025E76375|nr:hypothetical protein [Methanobrevibacter sp.]MBQ8016990.1 hypothetical protein [Methanobrevibacter sp.]